MKKIVKRIAAMGAAVMMMSSMAIGASASNGVNWKVYTPAKTPAGSGSTYARCNIQSNMKKIQYSVC